MQLLLLQVQLLLRAQLGPFAAAIDNAAAVAADV
jgi:hypothetical protein